MIPVVPSQGKYVYVGEVWSHLGTPIVSVQWIPGYHGPSAGAQLHPSPEVSTATSLDSSSSGGPLACLTRSLAGGQSLERGQHASSPLERGSTSSPPPLSGGFPLSRGDIPRADDARNTVRTDEDRADHCSRQSVAQSFRLW